jgi:hypothetical protein
MKYPPSLYNKLLIVIPFAKVNVLIKCNSLGLSPVKALKNVKCLNGYSANFYSNNSCFLNPKNSYAIKIRNLLVKREHIVACENLEFYNNTFLNKELKNKQDLNSQSTNLIIENLDLDKTILEKEVDASRFLHFLIKFNPDFIPELRELIDEIITYIYFIQNKNKGLKIKQSFFKVSKIMTIKILLKDYKDLNIQNFETKYYLALDNYILKLQSLFQERFCDESLMREALAILLKINLLVMNIGNEILGLLKKKISTLEKTRNLNQIWIDVYLERERLSNRDIEKLQNFAAILNICKKTEL